MVELGAERRARLVVRVAGVVEAPQRVVQAVFVYGYQDNNANTADPENDYGLVDYSGNAKPSLSTFKTQLTLS